MVFSLDGVSQRGKMGLCANHNPSGQRSRDVVYLALVFGIVAAARWIVHLRTTDR